MSQAVNDPLFTLEIKDGDPVKSLGLGWMPTKDDFHFKIKLNRGRKYTKRTLLSDLNRVFDPLGLLVLVFLKGKNLLTANMDNESGL